MSGVFLPKKFIQRYERLLGKEKKEFIKCCQTKLPKTIRVNTLKISVSEFLKLFEKKAKLKPLNISNYTFQVLKGPKRLGFTVEHLTGLFAVQETSSMLPSIILNPKPGQTVLDLTAAPGSKTTHLSQLMQNKGLIVAVEKDKKRSKSLQFNLERLGVVNAVVLNQNALNFSCNFLFDKILLDAPCSSEGLIRKNKKALSAWSENLINKKSKFQKKLILKAFEYLKPRGELVYSTCTLAPEENEEVVSYLLSKHKAELQKIEILNFKLRPGLQEWNSKKFFNGIENCARIYPQDNNTQAFFIAKIKKLPSA